MSHLIRIYTVCHSSSNILTNQQTVNWLVPILGPVWKRIKDLSQRITKLTIRLVRPGKNQISLGICPVWSKACCALNAWLRTQALFMRTALTGQTGQMLRLIWVFAGCTCHFVGFVMCWLIRKFRVNTIMCISDKSAFSLSSYLMTYQPYCAFNSFQKVVFCLALYTKKVNLQTFIII